jgi:hypothetical protein
MHLRHTCLQDLFCDNFTYLLCTICQAQFDHFTHEAFKPAMWITQSDVKPVIR